MSRLSIIIPSYHCRYVSKTIEDIYQHAKEDIEVIVILDGYTPDPPIMNHKNLIIIKNEINQGMRKSINLGVKASSGEYIMKTDDHCAFSEGFDIALKQHIIEHQISIPSRYSLDVVQWKTIRESVCYEYMAYPYIYIDRHRYGIGLYSKKWLGENGNDPVNMGIEEYYKREHQRKHIMIDDIMIFLGACWFTTKEHFLSIGGLDEKLFKTMYQEPVELVLKTYLSGGSVVVNKYAWYAHMWKGKDFGDDANIRGYKLNVSAMRETERLGTTFWMNNCWSRAKKDMKWFIEHFWPIPGWSDDWFNQKIIFEEKYMKKEMQLCQVKYDLKAI